MVKKDSAPASIPEKRYFRMGEVCRITELKPHVLRYWETEFPQLQPAKTSTNQRLYRRKDIENILLIKQLLYEKRFTIEGARKELKKEIKGKKGSGPEDKDDRIRQMQLDFEKTDYPALLRGILSELKSIRATLDKKDKLE
jgi:DNA-binding transcriptional MerR regulator